MDSDRNFVSDIYEQTKELDNVWSEEIPSNDYVRVFLSGSKQSVENGNPVTVQVQQDFQKINDYVAVLERKYLTEVQIREELQSQWDKEKKYLEGKIEFLSNSLYIIIIIKKTKM